MEDELFVQRKKLATKIFHGEDDTNSEDSDTEAPSVRSNRSTVVPRALKGQKQTVGSAEPAPSAKSSANEQAKPKKRKAPAPSKPGGDPAGQSAGGSKPKRRKVLEQDDNDNAAQPQTPLLETNLTQVPISQDGVAPASQRPQVRPKMRPPPPVPGHGHGPKTGADHATSSVSVPSTPSVLPPPAPLGSLVHSSKSIGLPSKESGLSSTPEDSPAPSGLLKLTKEGTHNSGMPSLRTSDYDPDVDVVGDDEGNNYDPDVDVVGDDEGNNYDPDVDVVGDDEENNHQDKGIANQEYHIDCHSMQSTPVIMPCFPPKIILTASEVVGTQEGPEPGRSNFQSFLVELLWLYPSCLTDPTHGK